jgi:hypothetical protein
LRWAPGRINRRVGFIAMAIFATTPIFIDQADTVSIDLLFAAFTAGALCALLAWRDEGMPVQLIACGLLAGASCGIRHTGFLVCVLLGVWRAPVDARVEEALRRGLRRVGVHRLGAVVDSHGTGHGQSAVPVLCRVVPQPRDRSRGHHRARRARDRSRPRAACR